MTTLTTAAKETRFLKETVQFLLLLLKSSIEATTVCSRLITNNK